MRARLKRDPFCARSHHPLAHALACGPAALLLALFLWVELWPDPLGGPFCEPVGDRHQVWPDRVYRTPRATNTMYLALCGDGTYGLIAREHMATFVLERGEWAPAGEERVALRRRLRGALTAPRELSLEGRTPMPAGQFEAEWRSPQPFLFHPEMNARRSRAYPVVDGSGS
ncbi:MAG TPA: hypothetical protein PK668_01885 [Myxococcota bacterium]|nr:hypothetical protein [Myxococcota bacterium]HRY94682.1 hypothetical protein [Myxococcota bacterium]HSA22095.1 hypothetical protein [Myxococcota bacterium]